MRRLLPLVLGCALCLPAAAQQPAPPQLPESQAQPVPLPPDAQVPSATPQPVDNPDSTAQQSTKKKPGRIKRALNRGKPNCVKWLTESCWGSDAKDAQDSQPSEQARPPQNPAPRSDDGDRPPGVSSSKDTKVDLSPPANDRDHEGADLPPDETGEFRPWDPHKADKHIEVGDFYFKRKNYRAAESRYREALYWKNNDAIATYRLAETLEKLGENDEAVRYYQNYLKILPKGDYAALSKKALERLGARPTTQASGR